MDECSEVGCVRVAKSRGLCGSHYNAWLRTEKRKRDGTWERTCPGCGTVFAGRDPRVLYCTDRCRGAHRQRRYTARHRVVADPRVCVECGVEFAPKQARSVYCSRSCAKRAADRRARRERNAGRACAVCGEPLDVDARGDQSHCSERCRHVGERARKYGLSGAEVWAMDRHADERGCAICGAREPGGKGGWHIDHCHDSGRVRGALCHRCNVGLGMLRHDPVLLRAAATYLD